MNSPIIYQVVGALLILFFFFLTYMFTKTWRWLHVTTMFFVFAATVTLTIYSSMTVRTHMAWKRDVAQKRADIERRERERDNWIHGDLLQLTHAEPSIRELKAELNRVLLDRGRVWRDCTPGTPAAGTVTVTIPAPESAPTEEGAEPPPPVVRDEIQPAAQTVVYALRRSDPTGRLRTRGGEVTRAFPGRVYRPAIFGRGRRIRRRPASSNPGRLLPIFRPS